MSNPNVAETKVGRVSRFLTGLPSDVRVILAFLIVVNLSIVVLGVESPPVRVALSAPLLLFLPGYVLVNTLFPRTTVLARSQRSGGWSPIPQQYCALDGPERAGLSFGMSLAVLPLFALVVGVSRWPYTVTVIVPGLSVFVLLGAAASVIRRNAVRPEERFETPFRAWAGRLRRFVFADGLGNTAVNVALVLSILLSVAAVGYAFAAPQDGERYSELTLLTQTEDGEYVAGEYPEEFAAGEERELVVGVENREQAETEYTIVVQAERVDASDGSVTVLEANELRRTEVTLDAGERRYDEHAIAPEMTGEDLRLSYYLYRGDAPETADEETAYRHVYVWIDVTEDATDEP